MTPTQCIAARHLLQWSRNELARKADVAPRTLALFETGERMIRDRTLSAIRAVLVAEGVEFSPPGPEGEPFLKEIRISDGTFVRLR